MRRPPPASRLFGAFGDLGAACKADLTERLSCALVPEPAVADAGAATGARFEDGRLAGIGPRLGRNF